MKIFTKAIHITLFAALLMLLCAWIATESAMAGTINTPTSIPLGKQVSGELTKNNPEEFYKIELKTSGKLSIDLKTSAQVTEFSLRDANKNVLKSVKTSVDPDSWGIGYTLDAELTKGTYYIEVNSDVVGYNIHYGKYSFTPYFYSANPTYENNTSFGSAASIRSGQKVVGHLAMNSNAEYFKINCDNAGKLAISASASANYGFFNVYNSERELVAELTIEKDDAKGELYLPVKKGTYYIEVISEGFGVNRAYGSFTLSTTFNSSKKTQTISAKSYTKVYGNKPFSLNATAKGKLSYRSSSPGTATVNSSGKVTIKNTGKTTLTITAAATESYEAATKKITVTVTPKKTSSMKVKKGTKSMSVSWKRDTKASGYQIVYAHDKKFKKSKKTVTISSNKTTKKTIKKLKKKTTYYVKVRAYKKVGKTKIYGSYCSAKSVKVR